MHKCALLFSKFWHIITQKKKEKEAIFKISTSQAARGELRDNVKLFLNPTTTLAWAQRCHHCINTSAGFTPLHWLTCGGAPSNQRKSEQANMERERFSFKIGWFFYEEGIFNTYTVLLGENDWIQNWLFLTQTTWASLAWDLWGGKVIKHALRPNDLYASVTTRWIITAFYLLHVRYGIQGEPFQDLWSCEGF